MTTGKQDEQLFAEAMGTVKRIVPATKIIPEKLKPKPAPVVSVRQAAPLLPPKAARSFPRQAEEEPWVLKADGMSRERLRRFAAGRPPVERSIDLHGLSRHEALALLDEIFGQAIQNRMRALCIIHGRGLHSEGRAVLREAVYQWLRSGAYAHAVLAVIPQPGSGGGACLVLLRRK